MMSIEEQLEQKRKILMGLEPAYAKLLEYKKSTNSVLIVKRDGKIAKIKPE